MKKIISQKRLKELLHYDPKTGAFTWIVSRGGLMSGSEAGSINGHRYRMIKIDGLSYNASRLAWLYIEGYFPEKIVEHKNRIRHDDRWSNLRHVSRSCNNRNCSLSKNNTSGVIGVHPYKGKWSVVIGHLGKAVFVGNFFNFIDAVKARWNAEIKHGYPNCNTTSSAFVYLKENDVI